MRHRTKASVHRFPSVYTYPLPRWRIAPPSPCSWLSPSALLRLPVPALPERPGPAHVCRGGVPFPLRRLSGWAPRATQEPDGVV